MNKRKLGTTEIEVSPLCFGGNVFGWTIDEATSHILLDAITEAGINFIDTADVYSTWAHSGAGGQSETIIGNWLKKTGKRDQVIIATKVGKEMGPGKIGLSADYIYKAVDDSLKRLQTDYIDLYQSHDDDSHTPLRETLEVYTDLIKQGKVRAIGASKLYGGSFSRGAEC
jgi:aryl-alcohol dehydrogenase-like predicted oxidoreductase